MATFEEQLRRLFMAQAAQQQDDDDDQGLGEDEEEDVDEGDPEDDDEDEGHVEGAVEEVDDDEDDEEGGAGDGSGPQIQLTQEQIMRLMMGQSLQIPGMSGMQATASASAPAREDPSKPKEWEGIRSLPAATQQSMHSLLTKLKGKGLNQLTVMVIGRPGVGKTSTINTLLNEKVSAVTALAAQSSEPAVPYVRKAAGFTLTVIDTPGITSADAINPDAVQRIAAYFKEAGRPSVDVFLFVERLDQYRVEPLDKQVMEAFSDTFGPEMWKRSVLVLTRAGLVNPPAGLSYGEFLSKRGGQLKAALRATGGRGDVAVVPVENLRPREDPQGQKILPDGTPILPGLISAIQSVADKGYGAFKFDPKVARRRDPNRRRRWLIPLILAAQVALKVFVLDRVLEEDGVTGDQFGPYAAEVVAEKRERAALDKEDAEEEKKAVEKKKKTEEKKPAPKAAAAAKPAAKPAASKAAAPAAAPKAPQVVEEDSDDEDEDEDEEDDE